MDGETDRPAPRPAPHERVEKTLEEKMPGGRSFRATLRVEMRGTDLYWLLRLAEWGLEKRREDAKGTAEAQDIGFRLSCGEWKSNIEEFADQICEIKEVKKPKKK